MGFDPFETETYILDVTGLMSKYFSVSCEVTGFQNKCYTLQRNIAGYM